MNSIESSEPQTEVSLEGMTDEEKVREIFNWISKKADEELEERKLEDQERIGDNLGQIAKLGGDRRRIEESETKEIERLIAKLDEQRKNLERGLDQVDFGCAIKALAFLRRKREGALAEYYLQTIIGIARRLKPER